ncbi:hypothetical protein H4582DRAFT_1955582 [Lactarius indigo]|nr:hypothetical protein H4582DRAFT_1955582 [Lactarius indigo]
MWRQVVDALSVCFLFFTQVAPSDTQAWGSCEILLQVGDVITVFFFPASRWTVPAPLHSVLTEISRIADEQQSPESKWVAAFLFCPCPLQLIPFFFGTLN